MKKLNHTNLKFKEGKVKGFLGADILTKENFALKMVQVVSESKYPTHLHPNKSEFVFCFKGKVKCFVEEKAEILNEGDFLVFPKNKQHSIENNTRENAILLVGAIPE